MLDMQFKINQLKILQHKYLEKDIYKLKYSEQLIALHVKTCRNQKVIVNKSILFFQEKG